MTYFPVLSTRHTHEEQRLLCQRINHDQAEEALDSQPLGAWIHRECRRENATCLSIKLAETIQHVLVRKTERNTWHSVNPLTHAPMSSERSFVGILRLYSARVNCQVLVDGFFQEVVGPLAEGSNEPNLYLLFNREEAEIALFGREIGTFLFRPSQSPDHVTLSYVNSEERVVHQRYHRYPGEKYGIEGDVQRYDSLAHIVENRLETLKYPFSQPINSFPPQASLSPSL